MQKTSSLYNQIFSAKHEKQHKVVINDDTTYDNSYIVSASRSSSLFGSDEYPSVGSAVSAQLELTLRDLPSELPRSSKLQFYERITNGTQTSEWISMGVYYISTRSSDSDGLLTIHAYDSLLKGDRALLQTEGDQGQWPKTDIAVINMILEDLDVELEDNTQTLLNKAYTIQYPGYGEDGFTEREILGYIAGMYGGNFEISKDNELRLVPLNYIPGSTWVSSHAYIVDDICIYNGFSYRCMTAHTSGSTFDVSKWSCLGYYVSYSNTEYASTGSARTAFTHVEVYSDESNYYAGTQTPAWAPNTAYAVGDYCIYVDITYKCVVAHTSGSTFDSTKWKEYSSIDVRTFSVYTPWATQAIANNLFNQINGFEYQPYSVSNNVCGNSAVELGDKIQFPSGVTSYIYSLDFTFDFVTSLDFAGTMSQESDDEYPYVSKSDRTAYRQQASIDQIKTSLIVMDGQITGIIEGQVRTFRGDTDPYLALGSSPRSGDLWYCTGSTAPYKVNTWYRSYMIIAWMAGTNYNVGDCVYTVNGTTRSYYKCKTEHTAGSTFDSSKWDSYSKSYIWQETTGTVNVAPDWEAETPYLVNDTVTYETRWYNCIANHDSLSTFDTCAAWAANTSYLKNDGVTYSGSLYKAKSDHTSGSSFDSSKWEAIDSLWEECDTISDVSSSKITQTIDNITLSVSNNNQGETSISMNAGDITITSQTISMIADTVKASALITAPSIQGGTIIGTTIKAGSLGQYVAEITADTNGIVIGSESKSNLINLGYRVSDYTSGGTTYHLMFPTIIMGDGGGTYGDQGMIKKFWDGIWIGDSNAENSSDVSGTGIMIDFNGHIYKYLNSVPTELGTAIFG